MPILYRIFLGIACLLTLHMTTPNSLHAGEPDFKKLQREMEEYQQFTAGFDKAEDKAAYLEKHKDNLPAIPKRARENQEKYKPAIVRATPKPLPDLHTAQPFAANLEPCRRYAESDDHGARRTVLEYMLAEAEKTPTELVPYLAEWFMDSPQAETLVAQHESLVKDGFRKGLANRKSEQVSGILRLATARKRRDLLPEMLPLMRLDRRKTENIRMILETEAAFGKFGNDALPYMLKILRESPDPLDHTGAVNVLRIVATPEAREMLLSQKARQEKRPELIAQPEYPALRKAYDVALSMMAVDEKRSNP